MSYARVVMKLSGETFAGQGEVIDFQKYTEFAEKILKLRQKLAIQLTIVVGGGNIFRGRMAQRVVGQANTEVDRAVADSMGMLATVINGLALQEALERLGDDTRLMTAVDMKMLAEPYIRRRALRHLEKGRIVIIGAGLGKPFFTTDTAVVHYAAELKAELILKGSTIDGIYDSDPKKNPAAKKFSEISFDQAVDLRLGIMDSTAFTLCRDNGIPILVFDAKELDKLTEFFEGKPLGTLVKPS